MPEILLQIDCIGVRPGAIELSPAPNWQVLGALADILTEEDKLAMCEAVRAILGRRIAAEVAKQQ